MPYLTKDDAIRTLIKYLEKSNIFSSYLSIQQIEIKLNEIVEKVEIEVLSSEGLSGYWETQDKKLGLDNKLFNPLFYTSANRDEVIIHELLHALTTKYINGKTFCGLKYYEKRDGYEEHGRGFNEGTTEYLAQLICPTDKPTVFEYNEKIKFKNVGTYKMEQIAIKQLAILYGQDKIIKAYLQNEDIEMPELQYKNLRDNFDFINEKNSFIRNILAEREYKDLTDEWKAKIDDAKNNISDTFITSQQYFLEQCLSQEIDNMETKEQAEELREKLKQLNDLGIEIKGNEKANYEKYNHKFIRKYLEIVNKDRSPQELVGFDAVEEYITSNQKILLQNESFFSKMKIAFNILKEKIMSRSEKEENRFIPIERGNEETIYIRECGKESVGGIYIKQYQYLTQQEYNEYIQTGDETRGQILRGDIDFKKIKKDRLYAKAVGEELLTDDRIANKLMNYSGYIGYVKDYKKHIDVEVEERFEADKKFISIKPDGYEEVLYIAEGEKISEEYVKQYVMLTKEEVYQYKKAKGHDEKNNIGTHIIGALNLETIISDKNYKQFIEKDVLSKKIVEERTTDFGGYVGSAFGRFSGKVIDPDLEEKYAKKGVNGEQKIESEYGTFYLKELASVGEKDHNGNEMYEYEVTTSDVMKLKRSNYKRDNEGKDEKLTIIGSKEDLKYLKNGPIESVIMEGGCFSDSKYKGECMRKTAIVDLDKKFEIKGKFFECNKQTYFVPYDNFYSAKKIFDFRVPLQGNIDIERINNDSKYRKFVEKMMLDNYSEVLEDKTIKGFEISEKDGEIEYKCIEAKKQKNRSMEIEH